MAKAKEVLASFDNKQTHQVVKLARNSAGTMFLQVDSRAGMRDKIGSMIEYARGRRTARLYGLENASAAVVPEGLRIEESNGSFFFVDLPQDEARRFVDIMEKNTSLLQPLGSS